MKDHSPNPSTEHQSAHNTHGARHEQSMGAKELSEISHADILDYEHEDTFSQDELKAIVGTRLEEMLLDIEDKKAAGEPVPAGATQEVKIALEFMNSIHPAWDDERSNSGKISDEIDRLKQHADRLSSPQVAGQKKRIEQKIRGLTLARELTDGLVNGFTQQEFNEGEKVVKESGMDLTAQQKAVIAGDLMNAHIRQHNERLKRNSKRQGDLIDKEPSSKNTGIDVEQEKAKLDRLFLGSRKETKQNNKPQPMTDERESSVETKEDDSEHSVVPDDPLERMNFARKFFVGENMTSENVPVLKEYLLKVLRGMEAEITRVQAEKGADVRYPNRLATIIGRTLPHELNQRTGPGVFLYEQIKDKMKVRDGDTYKTVDFVDFNMMKMDDSLKQLGIDVRKAMPGFYDKFTS